MTLSTAHCLSTTFAIAVYQYQALQRARRQIEFVPALARLPAPTALLPPGRTISPLSTAPAILIRVGP
eukprot:3782495-Rhodomonas_salina.1